MNSDAMDESFSLYWSVSERNRLQVAIVPNQTSNLFLFNSNRRE